MPFEKRLKTFIDICYKGNVRSVATAAQLEPSTLSRWIKEVKSLSKNVKDYKVSDPKLSHVLKLEKAGCNIAWLISGRGTMFAWNKIGDRLQGDKIVRERILNEVESKNPLSIIKNYDKKVSNSKLEDEEIINPDYYSKLFDLVNEKSNFLFTNYLFILLFKKSELKRKEDLLQGIEPSHRIELDEIEPYIPILIGALIHYVGDEPMKLIMPTFKINKVNQNNKKLIKI